MARYTVTGAKTQPGIGNVGGEESYIKPEEKMSGAEKISIAAKGATKGFELYDKVQKKKLSKSGVLKNPELTFKLEGESSSRDIVTPTSGGVIPGKWSKRVRVQDAARKKLGDSKIMDKLRGQGVGDKDIANMMDINYRKYNKWKKNRKGGTLEQFSRLKDPMSTIKDEPAMMDAFKKGRSTSPFKLSSPGGIPSPIGSVPLSIGDAWGWAPDANVFARIRDSLPGTDIARSQKLPDWTPGQIIQTPEEAISDIRSTVFGAEKTPTRNFGMGASSPADLDRKFTPFKTIFGETPVKNLWKESTPGKVISAFSKTKAKGGPGFFKAISGDKPGGPLMQVGKAFGNIGKGGFKALFGAKAGAAAATQSALAAGGTQAAAQAAGQAVANQGLLAGMGPLGWAMMAGSLLKNVIPEKTFVGKILKGIFSDEKLKYDIRKVGKSNSGVNVYNFKYKGLEGTYQGVLAQEVPWASIDGEKGYKRVNYNKLDVDFKIVS